MASYPLRESLTNTAKFLREYARDPAITGAVAPSSRHLARAMVDWIDWSRTERVMEWGPGTGSFTELILESKPATCRYLALEVNSQMCDELRRRFPEIELCQESVIDVAHVCERECFEEVDCLVSGLPWAAFEPAMQDDFLEAMMCVLRRGGQFTTFAYVHGRALPAGQRFRRKLRRYFSSVSTSAVVWRNLPPAFIYRCRR